MTKTKDIAGRIVGITLGALLASATFPVTASNAIAQVSTTETVNMRVAPNLSGVVIDKVAEKTALKVRCAALGALIYDTSVWLYIEYNGKRGFVSAYYADADYDTWADLGSKYGIPRCDRPGSSIGGSVYYQPQFGPGNLFSAPDPIAPYETYTATKDWWAAGDCSASAAAYWPSSFDGRVITRAGAWSRGRVGISYLLSDHFPRARALNTIILFDPGSLDDYRTNECDQKYDQDGLMAKWLAQDSGNRLLVLAGKVTRDADHPDAQGRLHQGIQRYLFPDIKAAGRSSQVLVCNYDAMSHPDVLKNFAHLIAAGGVTTCPSTTAIKPDASWRP